MIIRGTAYWRNMTEPYTLPTTKLWEGREAVLYAPWQELGLEVWALT